MDKKYRDYLIAGIVLFVGILILIGIWRVLSGIFSRLRPTTATPIASVVPAATRLPSATPLNQPTPTSITVGGGSSGLSRYFSPPKITTIGSSRDEEDSRVDTRVVSDTDYNFALNASEQYQINQAGEGRYTVTQEGSSKVVAEIQVMSSQSRVTSIAQAAQAVKELCLSDNPGIDGRCLELGKKEEYTNRQGLTGVRFYLSQLPAQVNGQPLKIFNSTGPYYLFPLSGKDAELILVSPSFQTSNVATNVTILENVASGLSVE